MPKGIKYGGRQKGTPNKANAELKAAAQEYGAACIAKLAELAGLVNNGQGKASSEQAQVSAITGILDRGYGKPSQPHSGDDDAPPIKTILEVVWAGVKEQNAAKS